MRSIKLNNKITKAISDSNIEIATGVPCGVLKNIISYLSGDDFSGIHVNVQNEPESIGVACGAALAGKIPLVYMQNSGLMKSINDICSLPKLHELPLLMVISHRGCKGENAPQHFLTGKITRDVIKLMDIPIYDLTSENIEQTFYDVTNEIKLNNSQAILLAKRGWDNVLKDTIILDNNKKNDFANNKLYENYINNDNTNKEKPYKNPLKSGNKVLNRDKTIESIMNEVKEDSAIIATTGLISRSLYENYDAPNIFYNVGGFGMTSSIGLGFALSKPKTKTLVIDGDCSLLTNLGSMVTIGHMQPKNLIHIVVDNNSYGSCNEENSCSKNAQFIKSAELYGYNNIYQAFNEVDISYSIQDALNKTGPTMIHIPIVLGGRRDFKRPKNMPYIAKRFINYFGGNNDI